MVQTSCINTYVEQDFLNLAKNTVKDEYADMLVNQWKEGNLIFKTKPNLKNDGETSFQKRKTKVKKSTVTIKMCRVLQSQNTYVGRCQFCFMN